MDLPIKGGCHCRAIRYEAMSEPLFMGHCQCRDCQTFSGTGHGSHVAFPKAAVSISGKAKIYDAPADSGNIVGRAFCPDCGTPIYSANSGMPDMLIFRPTSLDDPSGFAPQLVVYAKSGHAWDHINPALPRFERMPPPEAMPGADN